jgi:hypothetical protein
MDASRTGQITIRAIPETVEDKAVWQRPALLGDTFDPTAQLHFGLKRRIARYAIVGALVRKFRC